MTPAERVARSRDLVDPKHTNGAPSLSLTVELSTEQLDAIAERVAALLPERVTELERLLGVDELAAMLGTSPDWVRRHQAGLGAYRLSDGGGRNPIRFRASDVERYLAERRLAPPVRARGRGWRDDPDWALR
jgi:hypothetical protein